MCTELRIKYIYIIFCLSLNAQLNSNSQLEARTAKVILKKSKIIDHSSWLSKHIFAGAVFNSMYLDISIHDIQHYFICCAEKYWSCSIVECRLIIDLLESFKQQLIFIHISSVWKYFYLFFKCQSFINLIWSCISNLSP